MKPYVWSHSEIDGNGFEYITVMLEEPEINDRSLWDGGRFISFDMNHIKQRSECWTGTFHDGCPSFIKEIKTWKDEILVENECLKYAEEYMNK